MATSPDSTIPDSPQSENRVGHQPKAKHTPMNWAYDEDDARIYYDDGGVQPTIAYVEREGVASEQVKADGYLLAAAPSQNAALIDILDLITHCTDKNGNVSFAANAVQIRVVREALAEATGGAS